MTLAKVCSWQICPPGGGGNARNAKRKWMDVDSFTCHVGLKGFLDAEKFLPDFLFRLRTKCGDMYRVVKKELYMYKFFKSFFNDFHKIIKFEIPKHDLNYFLVNK